MVEKSERKTKKLIFKTIIMIVYLFSILWILFYFFKGFNYYQTNFQERPQHSDYRILRPAGETSHGFGVIGSAMMILMLLYSVRKRTKFLINFFPLSSWLKIHIYFGIIGPLFILLHTSFKIQGLVAVSFWSMAAVALSGIWGRYLYIQIPRTLSGNEIDLWTIL